MNVSFPDVVAPFTVGNAPISGTVDGTFYNYVLDDGDYSVGSLSGKILVTGDARLYVANSLSLSGQGFLKIASGGSLKMYVAAASVSIGGNGVINQGGMAADFQYYGLPTNTALDLKGNGQFTGVIYAPSANFHLGGGGNNVEDFVGASITATVSMNGHFNFHYDEALGRLNTGGRGYLPDSWSEMQPDYGLPTGAFAGVTLVRY
jgi:hypothetical protein